MVIGSIIGAAGYVETARYKRIPVNHDLIIGKAHLQTGIHDCLITELVLECMKMAGLYILLSLAQILCINCNISIEQVARRHPVISGLKYKMLLDRNGNLHTHTVKSGLSTY